MAVKRVSIILILQLYMMTIKASNNNVTTQIEDYIMFNGLQFDAAIAELDFKLNEFVGICEAKYVAIDYQISLFDNKLDEAEHRLRPLEFTSAMTKRCLNRYVGQLPKKKHVEKRINDCVKSGKKNLVKVLEEPQGKRNTLFKRLKKELPEELNICKVENSKSGTDYVRCVTREIKKAHEFTTFKKRDFYKSLQDSSHTADYNLRTSVECSFTTFYHAIGAINGTLVEVFSCIRNNIEPQKVYYVG